MQRKESQHEIQISTAIQSAHLRAWSIRQDVPESAKIAKEAHGQREKKTPAGELWEAQTQEDG